MFMLSVFRNTEFVTPAKAQAGGRHWPKQSSAGTLEIVEFTYMYANDLKCDFSFDFCFYPQQI